MISNDQLGLRVETSDEWIRTRTGIGSRRVSSTKESLTDLAAKAGNSALEMAGWSADTLDLVLLATSRWRKTGCAGLFVCDEMASSMSCCTEPGAALSARFFRHRMAGGASVVADALEAAGTTAVGIVSTKRTRGGRGGMARPQASVFLLLYSTVY